MRHFGQFVAPMLVTALSVTACRPATRTDDASPSGIPHGGQLVVSVRNEPRSFNRMTPGASDATSDLVSTLTQARLIRINHVSEDVEPALAESWTRSDDGLKYTMKLRPNVSFADGHAFTADDVLFSFQAAYDPKGTAVADALQVGGKKLQATAPDPHTVVISYPSVLAAAVRILEALPILPKHKLETALKDGTFTRAWALATPPAEMTGLGPFVLTQYAPGQRLVFERNPRYWQKDAAGASLPYLDRLVLDIVPEENTEVLRLESGQSDMTFSEVAPEAYATLKRAADAGKVKLLDLGVGIQPASFWINLKPSALANDPRHTWLQRDELRRAISMAVDRKVFADTVFYGAGAPVYGPVSPSIRKWYWRETPQTPHDPAGAKALLASIGLTDRNGDGVLDDASGQPARFTIVTQKGRPSLERGVAVIHDDLMKIGVVADVAALDGNAVIARIYKGNYDALFFQTFLTDVDPAANPDFWLSSGSAHFWNIGQAAPATDWERRIDELMMRNMHALDEEERKRTFDEVQKIFAEHLPAVYFVAPRVFVATSNRVANVTPSVRRPQLLWSPETIAVRK